MDEIQTTAEKPKAWERSALKSSALYSFGPTATTPIRFLDGLSLPASGAVIIGAKTGGGKTTALVNITREIRTQGQRVAFVSYEMNAQEIALSLALSYYAATHAQAIPGWTRNDPGPGERLSDLRELERALPQLPPDADPEFYDLFSRVKDFISSTGAPPAPLEAAYAWLADELVEDKIAIFDGLGNVEQLASFIRGTNYAAYVLDYLQVIPAAVDWGRDSYKSTQSVCDRLRELVNHDKKLLILGAQFNRQAGEESERNAFDPRPDQFREAADIEQIATLAIGIGYQPDPDGRRTYFFKILKNRFAGRMNGARMESAGAFDFCYAQRGGPWRLPENWTKPARKLRGNQQIIVDALTTAGGTLTQAGLREAFKSAGKRPDNLRQTIAPLVAGGILEDKGGSYFLRC